MVRAQETDTCVDPWGIILMVYVHNVYYTCIMLKWGTTDTYVHVRNTYVVVPHLGMVYRKQTLACHSFTLMVYFVSVSFLCTMPNWGTTT
jgi:hypothetical protein